MEQQAGATGGYFVDFAARLIASGASADVVQRRLIERGVDDDRATAIVSEALRGRADSSGAGCADIFIGALVLAIGAGVTLVTYALAFHGGTYVVAWGAMAWGVYRIIRGALRTR